MMIIYEVVTQRKYMVIEVLNFMSPGNLSTLVIIYKLYVYISTNCLGDDGGGGGYNWFLSKLLKVKITK